MREGIRRNSRLRKKIAIVSLGIAVGFFTWLVISVANIDASLKLVNNYSLPDFANLADIYQPRQGEYAVAIDGNIATGSAEINMRPTASTAKMILGLAIMQEKPFELGDRGKTITITQEMYDRYIWYIKNGGSNTRVIVNEEISEYDALMSVFLASSNNMADSLAIWAFGSLENYKTYATEMLNEWGIGHTTVGPDASGFSPDTTSTAEDLAKIGFHVLENPILREIVGTKSYTVPIAGLIVNTNSLIGVSGIVGIKTGWIGDDSGYCLAVGYFEGDHIITVTLLNASSRAESFNSTLALVNSVQSLIKNARAVSRGDIVGYYDIWWSEPVTIRATADLDILGWDEAEKSVELIMNGDTGILRIAVSGQVYEVEVMAEDYQKEPNLFEKIQHVFGWNKDILVDNQRNSKEQKSEQDNKTLNEKIPEQETLSPITSIPSENCTIKYGYLMLINPNFTVSTDFIDARKSELVSISSLYGIMEGNPYNGDNLLDAEAAMHINDMIKDYEAEYPGHTMETRSCYRARGTQCGRLCAATGSSDHHTGLTCDLLDPAYGTSLDTNTYNQHIDWQWLYANSYKYGFIDRFPETWAGGPMSAPLNVDENGSTGLFETWHYRYVGINTATEIATGKYNDGNYDSLEHYLKARGLVQDLKSGKCD